MFIYVSSTEYFQLTLPSSFLLLWSKIVGYFHHILQQALISYASQYTEHGEGLQVLHYEVGQKYEPHYDYFLDEYNTKNGGQRIATVLMYL
jgi:hypothetical protein